MRLTISLVLLILIVLAAIFLFASGFFNYLYQSLTGSEEYTKAQVEAMKKSVIARGCSFDGIKALIEVLNIGGADINATAPPLNFYEIRNPINNPDFEIDSDGDGIPDGWETSQKRVDVILVTDLSNSMSMCMDSGSTYTNCPQDTKGNVSNCKYEYPSNLNCTQWLDAKEEAYCVNRDRYFQKNYNLKVEKDWNNCTNVSGSTCSDPNYPNLWPFYNLHYITNEWESYSSLLLSSSMQRANVTSLPWNFNFFGKNFTKIWIATSGVIVPFNDGEDLSALTCAQNCSFCPSPDDLRNRRIIAPLWGNFNTSIYYDVKTNPDRVVITWIGNYYYNRWRNLTFQAVLYRSGEIRFNYRINEIEVGCNSTFPYWVIGISNSSTHLLSNFSNINSTSFTYQTSDCDSGSAWIEGKCNETFPYQVNTNVTGCGYLNSAEQGLCSYNDRMCSALGMVFSGNFSYSSPVKRYACEANECDVGTTYMEAETEDNQWHLAEIYFDRNSTNIKVYLDSRLIINYTNPDLFSNFSYDGFGFSAATGGANNNHIIDNVFLAKYISQGPQYSLGPEEITYLSTYRRELNITELAGVDLTNYTIKISLDTASLISQGKLRSDCGDLRFTNSSDPDPSTWKLYPYWIESGCDTENTTIWVKIDYLQASTTKTIYLHYGNSSAQPISNPANTFLFYDDFSTNPTNRWEVYKYAKSTTSEFYWNSSEGTLYLTRAVNSMGTMAFMRYNDSLDTGFYVRFNYKAGGGSGADGFAFAFYKDRAPYQILNKSSYGGSLGLDAYNSTTGSVISPGYNVEFDNYNNSGGYDPSGNHIAITETFSSANVGDNPHYASYEGPTCGAYTRIPCTNNTIACPSGSSYFYTKYEYYTKNSCNCSLGENWANYYVYKDCVFYNRSSSYPCVRNCTNQSGGERNYPNGTTITIYEIYKEGCNQSIGECDVGDYYNESNCGYYNRSCGSINTPACPLERSYLNNTFRTYFTKDICNESNWECEVGDIYQNCVWRTRSSCDQSACLAGESDQGDRVEYSTWKPSCSNGECDLGTRYVTECIEGTSCEVEGYFPCDQPCDPACGPAQVCCCKSGFVEHNCTLYSDYCCQKVKNCTTVTDYCCQKLDKCRLSADACCKERYPVCKLTQDVCCLPAKWCQARNYECCNVTAQCCKEKVKCCATIQSCEYTGESEVASCTPAGGSPSPPSCQSTCEIRREAYYCENVKVRLAKKVDKDFVSTVISDGHNVGLVAYGSIVASFMELTNNTTKLFNQINEYEANAGQTCISCAIQKSVELLKDSENARVVVLMSDGAANTLLNGSYNEELAKKEALDLACEAYEKYGIIFYTVGFGEEAEEELLRNISECTHGKFYKSSEASELKLIYTQIAQEISGRTDSTYKVYGNYSVKLEAESNAYISTGLIRVQPITYVLSQYVKTNITVGSFYINIYLYDANRNPIPFLQKVELKSYSTSQQFQKEEFYLDFKDQYSGVYYVEIKYEWYNETQKPEGSAWVDDIFFGPAPTCERIDLKSWKCGELIVTKIFGDGDPYIYTQSDISRKYASFLLADAQCTNKNCKYMISTPGTTITVDCYG